MAGRRLPARGQTRVLEPGLKVALAYRGEPEWHQRLLLTQGSPAAMMKLTGVTASTGERVWWVLTPDGDVYPEEIAMTPDVEAVRISRADGSFEALGDGRYVHAFTADRQAGPPGYKVVLSARAAAEASEREVGAAAQTVVARVDELAGPPMAGWTWRCCEAGDADVRLGGVLEVKPDAVVVGLRFALVPARSGGYLRAERVQDSEFDVWFAEHESAVMAYARTVTPRGEHAAAVPASAAGGESNEALRLRLRGDKPEPVAAAAGSSADDVRTLPVDYDSQGERHKAWRDVVRECWEAKYRDWPIEGPHSVLHLVKHFARHGGSPTLWLDRWCREKKVEATDRIYYELRTLAEAIETAGTYDQVNLPSLASFEILCRRWQTIIDAYGVNPSKPNFESAKFFAGKGDWTDGVCPELRRHVAQRATAELEIEKSRQKTRELRHDVEKSDTQGAGRGRGGGRGAGL